jgi:hypothetical protein
MARQEQQEEEKGGAHFLVFSTRRECAFAWCAAYRGRLCFLLCFVAGWLDAILPVPACQATLRWGWVKSFREELPFKDRRSAEGFLGFFLNKCV